MRKKKVGTKANASDLFIPPFFSQLLSCKGLFYTGQFPGNAVSNPAALDVQEGAGQIKSQLLRGRRRLVGGDWYSAPDRSWPMEGASPSMVLARAHSKSRKLAATIGRRGEASTALRKMSGAALAFVWARMRQKPLPSGLHRPHLESENHESAPFVLQCCSSILAGAVRWIDWMKSKGIRIWCLQPVALPHNGSRWATTSILLSFWQSRLSRLKSLRRVLVVTVAHDAGAAHVVASAQYLI